MIPFLIKLSCYVLVKRPSIITIACSRVLFHWFSVLKPVYWDCILISCVRLLYIYIECCLVLLFICLDLLNKSVVVIRMELQTSSK